MASATTDGGIGGKMGKIEKQPEQWAIAKGSAGIAGRKTYYNSW